MNASTHCHILHIPRVLEHEWNADSSFANLTIIKVSCLAATSWNICDQNSADFQKCSNQPILNFDRSNLLGRVAQHHFWRETVRKPSTMVEKLVYASKNFEIECEVLLWVLILYCIPKLSSNLVQVGKILPGNKLWWDCRKTYSGFFRTGNGRYSIQLCLVFGISVL